MKYLVSYCFFIVAVCLWGSSFSQESSVLDKPGWVLTFNDDFNGPNLNDLYWYPSYRMGRIEYLKRTGADGLFYDPNANYKIENGILKLIIDEKNPARINKLDPAVSCIMTSDHRFGETTKDYQVLEKFSQKYGWFEVRCKTVKGSGLLCAFWLHQTDPTDQEYTPKGERKKVGDGVVEIDIFEQLGREAKDGLNQFNVHFTKDGHHVCKMGFDPSEDFHVYAMEWKEGQLNWYVDGEKVYTYNGDTPQKKMYIHLAIFHGRGWTGPLEPNIKYPKIFEVDYARVYQRENDTK